MRSNRIVAAAVTAVLSVALAQPSAAQTTEIKVLCSTGLKAVMEALVPEFERTTRHKVVMKYDTAAALKQQIDRGESFDLAVVTPPVMDDLIKQGKIAADTRTSIARSGMALAIRLGARKPDISTTDALKRTLLEAKSIAYAKEGASGVYFAALIQRLGIADALKPKSKLTTTGEEVGQAVASGTTELGVLPVSEILPVRGADVLGTFPTDVQSYAVMMGGVGTGARASSAAKDLLKFVTAPAALPVIKKKGMERN